MKYRSLLALAVVFAFAMTAFAQDGGQGGTIVLSETSDPSNLNPLLSTDTTSSAVWGRLYPEMFGLNYFTGAYEAGAAGSLATGWEYNEDGTALTITMREDAVWSDGTSITAHDYVWGVEALRTGLLDTPRGTGMWEALDDGTSGSGSVVDVVAVDDYTVEVTFNKASCTTINDIFGTTLPSHIFDADFGDDLAAMNEEPMYDPGVYFNVWQDPNIVAGDRVSFVANQDFPDTQLGFVNPDSLVILNLPDADISLERFRAGELTIEGIPGDKQAEIEADGSFQTYRYNSLGYTFFAFNHANPTNALAGYTEDGEHIEQDPHPVLGDARVRQAIAFAVDMDAIIENNNGGNSTRIGTPSIPTSWDFNADLLYPFDPATASDLLSEAGWEDTDGNGIRECVDCAQMEIDPAYEGTEMTVVLNAPDGQSENGTNRIEFIAQSMRDVGINAEPNYIDWGSAFIPALLGQSFDMAILSWSLGLPLDPDNRDIFGIAEDVPEGGFNFVSYHSEAVEQLYADAVNPALTDGCTIEGRKAIYDQINEIMFDELPYMFMYASLSMTAAQGNVENWDPAPFSRLWQEDAWALDQ